MASAASEEAIGRHLLNLDIGCRDVVGAILVMDEVLDDELIAPATAESID